MIPRTSFNARKSLYDLYHIDGTLYRRFDATRTAFIQVGKQDTGETGPLYWTDKMSVKVHENIEKNVKGKSRSDYALHRGSHAVNFVIGTYGDQNANRQFLKWAPLFVPEVLSKSPVQFDPDKLTSLVKEAAMTYGSDLVGITELDRRWVYDRNIYKPFVFRDVEHPVETEDEFVIPNSVNRAVVIAIRLERGFILQSPDVVSSTATGIGYSMAAFLTISLAEFIRALGYNAIPCMNDTALSIPLAVGAGLGQLGRLGLLITPEYGPCVRLCKVLTDMPLNTDRPIDFGVTEFCSQCLLCARACPAGAISSGARTFDGPRESNNPGTEKWYIDAEKCLRFWQANGTSCSNCIAACPFTVDFSEIQCLKCETCIAPGCPLQLLAAERLRYGYLQDKKVEEQGKDAWEHYVERKYFSR